jgi:aryl-alcohol dehydrogenase-like predicted oxidoreductase
MSKLALGTVQFGQRYGIANTLGQPSLQEVGSILSRAATAGLDTLDTAVAYGDSERVLGSVGVSDWRIVSKLPRLPDGVHEVASWVDGQVRASLQRLQVPALDGLLLHHPADLVGSRGEAYRAALRSIKAAGLSRAVGVSIYDPEELERLWTHWRPDIVQAPLNVFDRRLIAGGWLARLRTAGVTVHTRSAFLQGLLLMPPARRPAWFDPWRPLLDRWWEWCRSQGVTPLQAALAFVLSQAGVDRVIVGVDSGLQLDEVLAAAAAGAPTAGADMSSDDRTLLEPLRWKLA